MRYLRTYEGYWDPPEPQEHPLFELTLDKLYGLLMDDNLMSENEADLYIQELGEWYWESIEQWLNNIDIDYNKYPIEHKRDISWSKQKEQQKHKICADISEILLEILKDPKSNKDLYSLPPIEEWLRLYNAEKFNL